MRIFKPMFVTAIAVVTLASCSSVKNMAVPTMDTAVSIAAKKGAVSDEQFNHWAHADLATDTIPGMSVDKAYKFLEGKTGETVIVAVIDSGIDIEHEDLKDVIWTNSKEVAGNGIDDDKNGYIDDIHGWNFLGGDGVAAPEQLEITRIVAKLNKRFEGKTDTDISEEEKESFAEYQKYLDAYKASSSRHFQTLTRLEQIGENYAAIKKFLGKDSVTLEDLQAVKTEDQKLQAQIGDVLGLIGRGLDEKAYLEYYETQKKNKNYDFDFDGRAIVGDKPQDINDKVYGNANVIGSKDEESHGTHVAGIILATRNNGIGLNGVANNAKLMSVRAVPDGDERDKDVALAIRYAVDNGAKVINMSFGKSFSPYRHWVFDAIKYAEEKDVLLVHAAGNDHKNIDVSDNWPNDSLDKINEIADNVLTIGAMSVNYDENLPATFTNYGQKNVDVFGPGVQIYSTVPNNEYAKYNGTSMASPEVAGVATLVRSYYPQLSASQVKHIIMNSGTAIDMQVMLPGSQSQENPAGKKVNFSELSISGKVANAYNALILADKMVNGK
ncbi:S8 family peptidase [Lutibacter flavus]|uniref:Subtilase family protein n=1 Tax=Lutibacter flavus TaxID=691689 RepID=A0A238X2D1_9FLAO|nr:S8 family peptidase [Lutibacter flavus]SNR52733.1 Subtilase family protein [Lutibacter flavus]